MAKNKNRQVDANACPLRKTSIGGQALMEGIMMRGPKVTAMAVRNTKGEMVIEKFPTTGKERAKFFKLPIIRGVFGFIDSMTLGYKCLMRSAEISGLEEIEEEMAREKAEKKAAKAAAKAAKKETATPEQVKAAEAEAMENVAAAEVTETADAPEAKAEKKKEESSTFTNVFMVISMILAIGLMLLLFFWLPTFLYKDVVEKYVSWFPKNNRFLQSVCETGFRLLLMLGYMLLMRLMKDIRRTFQFHGAEHKTIFCYEHGLELTVENVKRERRFHPRCGTSFLILMLLVGIVIGFFIPAGLDKWLRVLIKLLLLPVTMGIGYELIKICGKHDNWLTRIIAAPGLWFQRITVMEPDDEMIECAIAAMKEVIPEDGSDQI
ncbi:MAG: DUF1385 domain-containing protein [Clostridia bacterium]|nr:DUF1385 domain-containing protein [Clostridia bacterium]